MEVSLRKLKWIQYVGYSTGEEVATQKNSSRSLHGSDLEFVVECKDVLSYDKTQQGQAKKDQGTVRRIIPRVHTDVK